MYLIFFFSGRRRHTRSLCDWSSDVCSSDLYHAMVTGQLAGQTAADALARGQCGAAGLAAYEARWRREIGRELADSLRIQRRLCARPALVDTVIRAAAADPRLCRLLARVALGEEDLRTRKLELALRRSEERRVGKECRMTGSPVY